ncbi:MAG: FHA domain-containing protein, partial [Acidimicrobiales bacterium]|nr:FHA domain-containing protein [Acidimicrobiales bacterium]
MRLHIERDGRSTVVAVAVDNLDATIAADLADALGLKREPLFVDDRLVRPDEPLSQIGLVEGSRVTNVATPAADPRLAVVSGPDAGASPSTPTVHTIGRSDEADWSIENPSISGLHAHIELLADGGLELRDLSSHNGTWLGDDEVVEPTRVAPDQAIRLGSSQIELRTEDRGDQPVGVGPSHADNDGRILFNRPPRPPVPPVPTAIVVPAAPPERTKPTFSLIALLAPIVMAVVMVVVLGRPQYAIFALLSPMMLVGNYVSSKRKVKRERSGDAVDFAAATKAFAADLEEAGDSLRRRHKAFGPDLVEVRRRVEVPSNRLWERRPDAPDAMIVRLGVGAMQWDIPLDRSTGVASPDPTEVADVLDDHATVDRIELLADLENGPVGVVGSAVLTAAVGRSIVAQLATHRGPADLQIAILTSEDRLADWSWAQWLPHTARHDAGVHLYAGASAATFGAELSGHLDETNTSTAGSTAVVNPGWLLVVDDVSLLHGRSSPIRRALEESQRRVFGLVLTETEDQLPSSVATIASIENASGEFRRREPGTTRRDEVGVADLPSVPTVERIARAMARFEDPELALPGGVLPGLVRPDELWGEPDASTIREQWRSSTHRPALDAVIGVGESGPVAIDFVQDGPHGLVAGTTGAGKSELLRTLVVGLALNHSPDELVFVLVDYKGGSAFDRCANLPHVVGMVTDLDDHLAERALISLEAELHHRERVLRDAGASDLIDYRREGSVAGPLPRLMVVIDEFATLRTELPEFISALVGVAQRGRSLGVHLVLATQRPSGAVDANIKANTNLRIALRVQDDADSMDVVDTKDAAELLRSQPGRAFVRRGQADLSVVQTAYVSGLKIAAGGPVVRTASVPLGDGRPPALEPADTSADHSDLEGIVDAITAAAIGIPSPRRPWLDDIPSIVEPDDVDALPSGDAGSVVLAVGDDPAHQQHVSLGWSPEEGSLIAYGALGGGVTTLLRSAIARLSTGVNGRPVWVFAADHGAGGLHGVSDWGHVSCCLEPNEVERHERLMVMLSDLVEERRAVSAVAARELPLVVLAIDGVAGFVETTATGVGEEHADAFNRIVRDGPSVGVVILVGANRPADVPRPLAAAVRQRYVLELSDHNDYAALGIRMRSLPRFRPGRALVGDAPTVAQVVDWERSLSSNGSAEGSPPP